MSGTDLLELGRMIRTLQQAWTYKNVGTRWYSRRTEKDKRRWSDKQICELLKIPEELFTAAVAEAEKALPRSWTRAEIQRTYITWVLKNKRWPQNKDFRKSAGLMSRDTANVNGFDPAAAQREMLTPKWWKKMTPELILSIPNLTVRRDAMKKYGADKLIRKGGGTKVQQDDFGTLWRLPTDGADPHQIFVEVVNKTPKINEKTGEVVLKRGKPFFDHYFLRVPPTVTTAREAVAWGMNIDANSFSGFDQES